MTVFIGRSRILRFEKIYIPFKKWVHKEKRGKNVRSFLQFRRDVLVDSIHSIVVTQTRQSECTSEYEASSRRGT